jgi:hypothetical protein
VLVFTYDHLDFSLQDINKLLSFMAVIHHPVVLFRVNGDEEGLHMFLFRMRRQGFVRVGLSPLEEAFHPLLLGGFIFRRENEPESTEKACDLDHYRN